MYYFKLLSSPLVISNTKEGESRGDTKRESGWTLRLPKTVRLFSKSSGHLRISCQLNFQGRKLESKQTIGKDTVELKYKGNQVQFISLTQSNTLHGPDTSIEPGTKIQKRQHNCSCSAEDKKFMQKLKKIAGR